MTTSHEFVLIWSTVTLTDGATSVAQMADLLRKAASKLYEMHEQGVRLQAGSKVKAGLVYLLTESPAVAEKFGFDEVLCEKDERGGLNMDRADITPITSSCV